MVSEVSRSSIIENNIGLVHSCANKFRGRGVEYDDLFQAGCVGLIKAADGFDAERGFSFSTYAVPVILGEIKRIFRDGGTVKVSRSMKEKIRVALKEKEKLAETLGYEPTVSQLAEKLNLSLAETAELLTASMPAVSLTGDDENNGRELDIPVEAPEEKISEMLALRQTIDTLEEEERKIIELRYYKGLTQSKTAEILNLSQVQISRKEKKTLLKMRKKLLN
ncbi:MAG: sigma-70 family RNA polymerase sigma factor [Clostridia bacterium]|nr:sigma-70 family RNA polymerase sigma factor [Clostridia bacterium]